MFVVPPYTGTSNPSLLIYDSMIASILQALFRVEILFILLNIFHIIITHRVVLFCISQGKIMRNFLCSKLQGRTNLKQLSLTALYLLGKNKP